MNEQKKREKRLRELKLREAEERREFDLRDADDLVWEAQQARRNGDAPAVARLCKKALALYPEHHDALDLLGLTYFEAGQFADSGYYFGILRKLLRDPLSRPGVFFNYGLANHKLGRMQEAKKAFDEFLGAMLSSKDPHWESAKQDAKRLLLSIAQSTPASAPVIRSNEPAVPKPKTPPAAAVLKPELPGVSIEFLPIERPDFGAGATLADHFLRRRFLEFRRSHLPRIAQRRR